MLQTEYKPNRFVNRPPIYEPIIQLLNWFARFWLYKVKWSCSETSLNGLKAGWKASMQAEWFTSSLNGLQAA